MPLDSINLSVQTGGRGKSKDNLLNKYHQQSHIKAKSHQYLNLITSMHEATLFLYNISNKQKVKRQNQTKQKISESQSIFSH